jgi:hypothetical protein
MTPQEIMEFFDQEIDTANFAKCIRQFNHVVMEQELNHINDNNEIVHLTPIVEGVYWTNKFAEMIDPYFDK